MSRIPKLLIFKIFLNAVEFYYYPRFVRSSLIVSLKLDIHIKNLKKKIEKPCSTYIEEENPKPRQRLYTWKNLFRKKKIFFNGNNIDFFLKTTSFLFLYKIQSFLIFLYQKFNII